MSLTCPPVVRLRGVCHGCGAIVCTRAWHVHGMYDELTCDRQSRRSPSEHKRERKSTDNNERTRGVRTTARTVTCDMARMFSSFYNPLPPEDGNFSHRDILSLEKYAGPLTFAGIVVQSSAYSLMRSYSRSTLHELYSTSQMLLPRKQSKNSRLKK